MSTVTAAEYAARSARSYEAELRQRLERLGTPTEPPERAGRRAAVRSLASQRWTDQVGPFHDTAGACAALGDVTRQAVSQRVLAGRLLGLRLATDDGRPGRLVYPIWQFESSVLRHLAEVLVVAGVDATRPVTGWTVAAWLTTSDDSLSKLAPLDLLRAGRLEELLPLAREVAASLGVAERAAVAT